ncbi:hypothetical protein FEM48_Zijuj04G0081700 [Ziziphus jujuba var. spinosa]|uniref:Retrovirus-related Pol polyprotein from transposon TNT 1-94-like beta-barrel domain-containing protein n=1 Tax=Ziziphus jujuba var. spinosa TaxID=714518 RepID=A0A978VIR8_ZIZJJ|nr:hypothetical protein FEM48_Zijuj04G0081700 [Ziziphus jujuba var. spinosa]
MLSLMTFHLLRQTSVWEEHLSEEPTVKPMTSLCFVVQTHIFEAEDVVASADIIKDQSVKSVAHLPHQEPSAFMASPPDVCDPSWYVDSGTTYHITSELENPSNLTDYKGHGKVIVGNGQGMKITHIGEKLIPSNIVHNTLSLRKFFVVAQTKRNLISVAKLTSDNDVTITFNASSCVMNDKLGNPLLERRISRGLYQLSNLKSTSSSYLNKYSHRRHLPTALVSNTTSSQSGSKLNVPPESTPVPFLRPPDLASYHL